MNISVYSTVLDEEMFIGYFLMALLSCVDEILLAVSPSTDGTTDILNLVKQKYDKDNKIKVFDYKAFDVMSDDWAESFNWLIRKCKGKFVFYVHPDMILTNPGIGELGKRGEFAYYITVESFSGEALKTSVVEGRTDRWKLIMRNAMGVHYWGPYGHMNEDIYFKDITGDEHLLYQDMNDYPYKVWNSGIKVDHYCECKSYARRLDKMQKSLRNMFPNATKSWIDETSFNHPRVHLKSGKCAFGDYFKFVDRESKIPEIFYKHKDEFESLKKNKENLLLLG